MRHRRSWAEARRLIEQLKSNIDGYTQTIERLEGEKIVLAGERDVARKERDSVSTVKDSLNKKVDLVLYCMLPTSSCCLSV